MSRSIKPAEAKAALRSCNEIALLDLREPGPFSMGHPFFATPCPYSALEMRVTALVPRLNVPIVLIEGGDGIAGRAAGILETIGYTDVAVIEGGTPGWQAAGFTLYKGVNVPSKTLGELAEHRWHPKTIDAETLVRWKEERRTFHFFDCRPPEEYAKMTVPGTSCLPNGETAHRLPAMSGDAPIVLTCAGRTRGLIGVLSLNRIAPFSEIYALENGTQGWALAGLDLQRRSHVQPLPALDAEARAVTRMRAGALIREEAIPVASAADIEGFLDDTARTTFLIDVRSETEEQEDPLPGFVHALSGQLVQATDQWIGVRHARVVLADDLGLRAGLAAWWLRMLGYEPHVALIDDALRSISSPQTKSPPPPYVADISARSALEAVRRGAGRFIDLRSSSQYRKAHIKGAAWSTRPHLGRLQPKPDTAYYLIADDLFRARLAAGDLMQLHDAKPVLVEGGMEALIAVGAEIVASPGSPAPDEAVDYTWFAHGRHDGDLDASRLYLDWEQGLVDQLDIEERAAFSI